MKKLLSIGLALTMAASLAACGGGNSQTTGNSGAADDGAVKESQAAGGTEAAQNAESQAAGSGETITLRVMDSSDSTQERRKVFNEEFMERHPEIKIEYTMLSGDQLTQTLTTAIKSGDAPDLFSLPSGVKLSTAVSESWYQPMTSYLSQEFIDSFETGALNEGVTTIDGEIYVLPEAANIVNSLMFYNKDIFEECGLDPENPPQTWSEFLDACKTITEKGQGKYYGIIESGNVPTRNEIELRSFANIAGAQCNYYGVMSVVDGKNPFASDAMKQALNLYAQLSADGSIHPDSINLDAPSARAMFAQGQAGFLIQGSWCIPTWRAENPDFNFGVMALPVPDDGAKGGNPYIGAQPWMGISATCEHPEAAALYLTELFGEDYQSKVVSDGGFVSCIKGVNEKAMTDEMMLKYYELAMSSGKLCPDPLALNPETADVYSKVKEVTPNLGQIVQGVMAGSITDIDAALDTFSEDTQAEWERAMGEAGVDISKFEFSDWDPMTDYDYAK
ncbi:MAG: sugar ABC transporter substrate-binding protein [Clostridiales bacterium]|nr:sugar ABC transporter substrate-binding protein [Clostridiales bacterium]